MATVLVIEDNEDNFELIKIILMAHDYEVRHAASGLDGVAQVIADPPEFVLLDIQLPDIDGNEVLRRIRQRGDRQHIPIIAITSYAMSGDRERLLKNGCNGYIEKPIDPFNVIEEIKAIVHG